MDERLDENGDEKSAARVISTCSSVHYDTCVNYQHGYTLHCGRIGSVIRFEDGGHLWEWILSSDIRQGETVFCNAQRRTVVRATVPADADVNEIEFPPRSQPQRMDTPSAGNLSTPPPSTTLNTAAATRPPHPRKNVPNHWRSSAPPCVDRAASEASPQRHALLLVARVAAVTQASAISGPAVLCALAFCAAHPLPPPRRGACPRGAAAARRHDRRCGAGRRAQGGQEEDGGGGRGEEERPHGGRHAL
ncbi:unnamed protein product [Chondrus crispus]|uniref:Uncharacterized protein n=1 Tax=Chondrus crispus TaxID=2769 RepID=R7Q334_CHOCR|nr:unnamed protein product [Chondrus crispus]CDF32957.1 unnamed protein product [Chondrus crispus]|eukprot:XP_005712760.1 unnamed protein product [Chondrus crispus]